jgi:hypothetical protein
MESVAEDAPFDLYDPRNGVLSRSSRFTFPKGISNCHVRTTLAFTGFKKAAESFGRTSGATLCLKLAAVFCPLPVFPHHTHATSARPYSSVSREFILYRNSS